MALAIVILGLFALVAARVERSAMLRPSGSAMVNDGDTLTLKGERIRLRGIDAPELSQICRIRGEAYPCGHKAKDALRQLIAGRAVTCEGWERDKYGRLLAFCRAGAIDLNEALVEQGWAVAFGDFQATELSARQGRRGLWAGEFDRPRQWRDTHGSMVEVDHPSYGGVIDWLRKLVGFEGS